MFQLWSEEAGKVRGSFSEISDRSRLFGPDIRRLERMFARMELLEGEGLRLVEQEMYDEAAARLAVLMVELRVLTLQLNYLIFASRAEDAGMVSTQWMDAIADMDRRTGPVLDALWNYDRRHVEAVYLGHQSDLRELDEELLRHYARVSRGVEQSRKAIVIADGVSLAISAAQLGAAAGSGGGPPTFQFPGLVGVGAGGVATAGTVVISAEALEAIRRLIQLGAISSTVLSAGLGATFADPVLVSGPMFMAPTPSGTLVPEDGPFKGQRVTYGDPRNKHTRFGHLTLEQLKADLKSASSGLARAFKKWGKDSGGQLSKEAVARYKELVRQALERGRRDGNGLLFQDASEIGIEVERQKPTRWYRVEGSPHGAHVYPIKPPEKLE